MPIYEYRCLNCGRKNTILILSSNSASEIKCKFCDSKELQKLVSRVAVRLSEESRLEKLSDPSLFGEIDQNDPRSIAKWMKKFGKELGDEIEPDFEDTVEEALEEEMTRDKEENE
ncbi:MAG: FmdB family zinc ribbon protein [Candidatus Aminicenantia bacterium]